MQWIKEVELVDSVDDLKSSSSIRGVSMPNFEVLDAKNCFSTEQNHPSFSFQKKNQSGGTKGPETGPFPSRKTDRLPDLRVLPGHFSQRFCRELCRPIYSCSTKWWYSGIRFEMGRNSIINDESPISWHLGRIVQIKNTSSRTSRPYWNCTIWNCTIWRFTRRKLDLIVTDWRQLWKEVSSRIYESIILRPETEIMRKTPWSRIRGQNSVDKEL